jgi:hypothetical protein
MRDIRSDLRERLEAAEVALKTASAEVEMLKLMLQNEEARFAFAPRTTGEVSAAAVAAASDGQATIQVRSPLFRLRPIGPAAPMLSVPSLEPQPNNSTVTGADLDEFLIRAVKRGVSDKDELRDAAIRAGYFTGSVNSPGRVVHARLTNLVRDRKLAKMNDQYVLEDNMKTAP